MKKSGKIGTSWRGGIYAGLSLEEDHPVALVLLPGELESTPWQDAVSWAKKQGGALPSRIDQLVLLQNLKSHFKPAWYWSAAPDADDEGYAWCQSFGSGTQGCSYKGGKLRAVAVRRVAI